MTSNNAGNRRLVIMRHAKAARYGATDEVRPLTASGVDDAAEAGRWLAARGVVPDYALVSSALRTTQTWTALREAAAWSIDASISDGLYGAGPEAALDLLRQTPDHAYTLVVIGHNPSVATLAAAIDNAKGDPSISAEMAGGLPPCALVLYTYLGDWATLSEGSATARAFNVGGA